MDVSDGYASGEVSDAESDVVWDVREGYESGEVSDVEGGDESALASDDGSALADGASAPPPRAARSSPWARRAPASAGPPCPQGLQQQVRGSKGL